MPNCKIYNDASCDISADGQLLAVFIPSSQRGFPDEGILAIYSLAPHNLGEMLYTKRFGTSSQRLRLSLSHVQVCRMVTMTAVFSPSGPNAISVSLSPMGCYVMVGLASRRILLHPTTDHMVAQVFRLQQPHGGETSIRVRGASDLFDRKLLVRFVFYRGQIEKLMSDQRAACKR